MRRGGKVALPPPFPSDSFASRRRSGAEPTTFRALLLAHQEEADQLHRPTLSSAPSTSICAFIRTYPHEIQMAIRLLQHSIEAGRPVHAFILRDQGGSGDDDACVASSAQVLDPWRAHHWLELMHLPEQRLQYLAHVKAILRPEHHVHEKNVVLLSVDSAALHTVKLKVQ
eukprot:scaffold1850_cov194-Pinguiococcus_pyrenoidosus.AAC.12